MSLDSLHLLSSLIHLFPYTTLFRSTLILNSCWLRFLGPGSRKRRSVAQFRRFTHEISFTHTDRARARSDHGTQGQHTATLAGDRKSTRLNSSHVASSYAVFCLKK